MKQKDRRMWKFEKALDCIQCSKRDNLYSEEKLLIIVFSEKIVE